MSGFCANPLFQPQCPFARSGGCQHNCRLSFGPRAIGDEIGRRLREEIRKVEKTSLLEKCRIGCSDDFGAGRGHAQPFGDRREGVVGETIAIVVSSQDSSPRRLLRLLHGLLDNPFGVERVHAPKARNEKGI
jgi:hypothetical protein